MFSGDFVKLNLEVMIRGDDEVWSEEETLLLLEGLEMFDDDWNSIAEHVGTRTKEQCVLHFLQLPIEDQFLDSDTTDLGPLKYNHIPFNQADNPVMSVVAFLASAVNPGVASAAAQAALSSIASDAPAKASNNATNSAKNGATDSAKKPSFDLQKAANAALGSAAVKAKVIADYEEKEIQRLINAVVEAQLRKMEMKMSFFEELESILESERKEIERQRQQLFMDRMALQKVLINFDPNMRVDMLSNKKLVRSEDRKTIVDAAGANATSSQFTTLP
jgi:SWI/SNF related-matrix-associated actin-dependent regulator of chromatin subfamily C